MRKIFIVIVLIFSSLIIFNNLMATSSFLSEFNDLFEIEQEEENQSKIFGNNNFELIKTIDNNSNHMYSVSFSNDGKYFVSSSSDKTIKIYSVNNWELIKTLTDSGYVVKSVSFSIDDKYLAVGNSGNEVKIYDTNNWQVIKTLSDHEYTITSVLFSPNGKYFASASFDNTVKIYDTDNFELIKTLREHSNLVYSVSFSYDGRFFASASFDNTVKIYNTDNWALMNSLSDYSSYVLSVSFSADGKYLASGSSDKNIKIYSTSNWELLETLKDHEYAVKSVTFSNDNKYLASANNGNTVILYQTNDWQIFKEISEEFNYIFTSIAFCSDGKYFATSGADGTVKIYQFGIIKQDVFIKKYVEEHINEWQKKGEFEKTFEYKVRMSNRDGKAEEFFNEAKEQYEKSAKKYWDKQKAEYVAPIMEGDITILGDYDADRETFKLDISTIGEVVINIPIDYAASFKRYQDSLRLKNPQVVNKNDNLTLSSIEVFNPIDVKGFVYDTNVKEDYNIESDMNFEFKPYNYSFENVEVEQQFSKVKSENDEEQEDKYNLYKNIPQNFTKNNDAVAVIIGNKDYKYLNNVKYAIKDVRLMKKYLMESFGYDEKNIIWLENASKGEFESVFGIKGNHKGRLDDYVKENKSDVFIYYSGHGAPDVNSRKGYFVPVDCNPATVALNGYPIDLLYENLSKIKYKKLTVIVDACFSGENTLKNVSPIFIKVDNPVMAKTNTTIYSSAKGDQLSTWYPQKEHSLFTYYFLKGIQEKGIDVTNSEMKKYLDEKVTYMSRRLHSREQNPTFNGDENEYLVK